MSERSMAIEQAAIELLDKAAEISSEIPYDLLDEVSALRAALSQPARKAKADGRCQLCGGERSQGVDVVCRICHLPIGLWNRVASQLATLRAENERLNRELELSRAAASAEALHADELQAELAERRGKYRDADVEDLIAVAEAARSRLYALLPANSIGPRIWQVIKALKETERTVSE